MVDTEIDIKFILHFLPKMSLCKSTSTFVRNADVHKEHTMHGWQTAVTISRMSCQVLRSCPVLSGLVEILLQTLVGIPTRNMQTSTHFTLSVVQ